MGIEKLLGKFYYDPKEGFMGVNNLFKKAKAKDKTVKLVDVKKWLKKQAVSQVHTRKSKLSIWKTKVAISMQRCKHW